MSRRKILCIISLGRWENIEQQRKKNFKRRLIINILSLTKFIERQKHDFHAFSLFHSHVCSLSPASIYTWKFLQHSIIWRVRVFPRNQIHWYWYFRIEFSLAQLPSTRICWTHCVCTERSHVSISMIRWTWFFGEKSECPSVHSMFDMNINS